jgi:hypothetical protein
MIKGNELISKDKSQHSYSELKHEVFGLSDNWAGDEDGVKVLDDVGQLEATLLLL